MAKSVLIGITKNKGYSKKKEKDFEFYLAFLTKSAQGFGDEGDGKGLEPVPFHIKSSLYNDLKKQSFVCPCDVNVELEFGSNNVEDIEVL